jgi:glyoxylase-like metal-dependent hydrolase (beta-lactamase superfamily II)
MRIYLEQLERLANLDAKVALPAHGEPIDDPSALFRHYIAHRLKREAKIAAALAGAPAATPDELVPVAYDDTPIHVWPIALMSLRAHLDKLVADGRAVVEGERYRLTA